MRLTLALTFIARSKIAYGKWAERGQKHHKRVPRPQMAGNA
jgi:hypothetical protein